MNADVAQPFTTRLSLSSQLVSELSDAQSRLRAVAQRSDVAVVVHAGGEVDAFNVDIWRRLISEAANAARSPGTFVVDVNSLSFMSCCAFGVLADEARRCDERRIVMRLVSAEPRVKRFVEACGFDGLLPIHLTAGAALAC
ncbi:STAS domain-containing protein [Mycobacterium ahvazicum]|uniref:Anti-sigma factor antagonist n=1 Tax=Mycobacterium ahvazicum TaxID=1964395 RepID=A0A2K4Y7B8_9MYCO|nr:anti-sigma factor antagonist [Mycobacterium ahvazicum]SOX52679.1 STAS domain-containing protein [Mycobacterium ahvazicum]